MLIDTSYMLGLGGNGGSQIENLLTNGSFEDGLDGWSTKNGPFDVASSGDYNSYDAYPIDGKLFVSTMESMPGMAELYQQVELQPGKYTIFFHANPMYASRSINIGVRTAGSSARPDVFEDTVHLSGREWHACGECFDITEDGTFEVVFLVMAYVYIDNVILIRNQ